MMPNSSLPSSRQIRELVGTPPWVDLKTAAVILGMSIGFPLTGWLYHRGDIPWWVAVLAGTWLMNLSFTAWHEPAHRNFSRVGWLNTAAGWLASFASVYPGYFARRREHLIHHRFEGQEGKDPVYPRIQTSFWQFPVTLLRTIVHRAPEGVPSSFLPLTPGQRVSDVASNLLALGLMAISVPLGFWPEVVLVWVVPRLIIFLAHAYYICFFPHQHGGDGFVVLRVQRDNPFLRFLTVNQHLHGIHHRWPWVPWHQYRRVLAAYPDEMASMAAELDSTSSEAVVAGSAPRS